MRRLRGLTEVLNDEFIQKIGITVDFLECLAILKTVSVEVFLFTRKIHFAIHDLFVSLLTRNFRPICISSYYKNQLRCFSISLFLLYQYLSISSYFLFVKGFNDTIFRWKLSQFQSKSYNFHFVLNTWFFLHIQCNSENRLIL